MSQRTKRLKLYLLVFLGCIFFTTAWSQENAVILNGGYSFANIEDSGEDATGWRINLTYEFNPWNGNLSHGLSVGYISTEASSDKNTVKTDFKLENWPVYYAPRYSFGTSNLKGFVKGAIGMHFSNYERIGTLGRITTNDSGFYGGLGLGGNYMLSKYVFLNVEYEWAYLSNYYYRDGNMNSIMGGLGFKF